MVATDFEFRYRFWIMCLVYLLGLGCYGFDHINLCVALVYWIFGRSDPSLDLLAARRALRGLFLLSAMIITASACLRSWATAYLRADVVHDGKLHTEELVADGPYRHLRNPLYLGDLLLAAGLAMLASRAGAVVIILGQGLIVARLIGREEAALIDSRGEAYRVFLKAVPRLWPSLRSRLPPSGIQPKWFQALLGEAWAWMFTVNGFLFAWRRNEPLYYKILGVFAIIYFLLETVSKRRRERISAHSVPAQPSARR